MGNSGSSLKIMPEGPKKSFQKKPKKHEIGLQKWSKIMKSYLIFPMIKGKIMNTRRMTGSQ